MTYYYQRLIGALVGFFVVGPLLTGLVGTALGLRVSSVELLMGAVIGAIVGAYVAGRVAGAATNRGRA